MPMINALSYILFGFAVITAWLGFQVAMQKKQNREQDKLFFYYCVSSTWWSFFFSMVLNQTSVEKAYLWRAFGQIGVFAYLILATLLMVSWTKISGWLKIYIKYFSFLGIFIFPFTIRRDAITFEMSSFGMSYHFKGDIWDSLYSFYSIILAINMMLMIIYMWQHSKCRRQKKMAKQLIVCELVIVIGMALDTICPSLGIGAFPGSSLGQFFGVVMLYQVLRYINRSRITMNNFSGYIYYVLETPILLYDVDEKLVIVNNSATQFLKLPAKNYEDYHLSQLFRVSKNILCPNFSSLEVEASCIINNDYCKLSINKLTDEYDDTIGYIVAVSNLTDKMDNIAQLGEERLRADEANKAKSLFLAKISHEIRTPINAVLGMDEMILRETQSDNIFKYAADIQSAGSSLLSIVNDILDFSKIESGKMQLIETPYDLGALINDLKKITDVKAAAKGLELNFSISQTVPHQLFGDETRIRQVLINLLDNAVKYTEKGCVTFELKWEETVDESIILFIDISDTGIGIQEKDQGHLFEVFQRLNEQKTYSIVGTGLGLSIVKKTVEMLRGEISVKSTYGEGSTFSVKFRQRIVNRTPLGSFIQTPLPARKKAVLDNVFTAPNAKILAIDDNMVNLSVVKGLLKRTKIQIDTAISGRTCIELTKNNHYDIILLDHMMPDMDGMETLTHLKELNDNPGYPCHNVPIIVLTANAITGVREMYIEHGFTDYLSKPIQADELESLLLKYLDTSLIEKNN